VLKEALKDPKYYFDKRTGKNRYYTRESAAEALTKLEIEAKQKGDEYIVTGQKLQEEIPTKDVVVESERLYQRRPNRLKNSGFEYGTGNKPSNWFRAMVSAPGLKLFWDKQIKYGGKASAAIANTHVSGRVVCNNWAQNITAFPRGKRLELSGYVKTKNVQDVVICAQCWSSDNKILAFGTTQTTQKISGTTDWTKYTAFVTAPYGTDKITVRATLIGTGQVWFDDIQLAGQKLQKEIPLTPEEKAKALYTLGENYRLNKMYSQAIREYEKLIKEYPKTTWAAKAREQLKKLK
ncbi:tetratricopeptide repeat protein, partial [bacterium]|nr:tetratricopeptide repeat protein [bacterium]